MGETFSRGWLRSEVRWVEEEKRAANLLPGIEGDGGGSGAAGRAKWVEEGCRAVVSSAPGTE